MLGLVVVVVFLLLALTAPWLAPRDPFAGAPELKFTPPFWQDGGKWSYLFGTDILGRDVLSRLLFGARLSLMIGFISVLVGASIGIPLGMQSGFFGGAVDTVIMRLVDVMLAFPSILLAVCIVSILGPSL
jgi:dipeptide transport system permease protein